MESPRDKPNQVAPRFAESVSGGGGIAYRSSRYLVAFCYGAALSREAARHGESTRPEFSGPIIVSRGAS